MLKRVLWWFCAVMMLMSNAYAESEADKVLERVFAAYGGKEQLMRDTSLHQAGITASVARSLSGTLKRSFLLPDKMRIEINYQNHKELRILNGATATKDGEAATAAFRAAAELQAARLMLPRLLLEHRSKVVASPADSPANALFEFPYKNYTLRVEVEMATGYIVHSEGTGKVEGIPMSFATAYDDFRVNNGRVMAYREKHYAMGNHVANSVLDGADYNIDFPEETFR